MKKILVAFLFLFTISTVFTGCRDEKTPEEKVESAIEDVKDDIEDASDDVKDAAEDLQDEIEEAAEEAGDDN
ncbi:hypothetical protein [Psychroserpens algicola]|uniref:YtxH domain-containing protein n=1 Tax=Psychroserpens algicola TaxID=1719034 RepID=A0ABT0HBZ0_9FLAO|nr:hypothetical protein [Psychroserpens algicola]MCK8481860.1 hypothetical protein [Psychroserpens algicola]